MKDVICFDNGGESYDRYTVLNAKTGEMIGASAEPYHPMGFGQHVGNVADNYWHVAYGSGWRRGCDTRLLNRRIKFGVQQFLNDCTHIGKKVEFETLPADVQKFAQQSFT
jgi:hypothetical protein